MMLLVTTLTEVAYIDVVPCTYSTSVFVVSRDVHGVAAVAADAVFLATTFH